MSQYVVSIDPGKNFGVCVWENYKYGWELLWAAGSDDFLSVVNELPEEATLVSEGTSFGPSAKHIARCVGRFEGALGVEAIGIPVSAWRRAAFTKGEYAKTAKKRSRPAWKKLAVEKARELGYGKYLPGREAHHCAEALLVGYVFVHWLVPDKKLTTVG